MSFLEDLPVGAKQILGTHIFDKKEMIAFAKTYDPRAQYIVNEADLLTASPWYVTAVWMQMMMQNGKDNFWDKVAPQKNSTAPTGRRGPSPGFIDLTYPHPVYAGDEITFTAQIAKIIKLKSRPKWGIARNLNEALNKKGDIVMRFFGQVLVERRDPQTTHQTIDSQTIKKDI